MPIDEAFRFYLENQSAEGFEISADVTYIIDDDLRLRGYNDAWREFASNNGGAIVLSAYGFGRSILDAMTAVPRAYYSAAYRRVLATGERFDQRFQCPSSRVERELQQSAYPLANGRGLIVTNHLVQERPMDRDGKEPSPQYLTGEGLVVQCSHCRRTQDQRVPHWVEHSHPATSHSFCPACFDFYYGNSATPAAVIDA